MGYGNSHTRCELQDLGDLAGAKEQLERALTISEAALGPDVAILRGNLDAVLQALQEASPEGPASAV